MRGLFALGFVVAGIALTVLGVAQLAGVMDGSGGGALAGGLVLLALGVMMVRRMAVSPAEAPIPAPSSLGDHPLADPDPEPIDTPMTTAPQSAPAEPRAAVKGRAAIIIFAAISVLVAMGGVFALLESEPPNVAAHIKTACEDALRAREGAGASIGRIVEYDAVGFSFQEVTFETSQGWTWTCTYNTETGEATAGDIIRG